MQDTSQYKINSLKQYWLCILAAGGGVIAHFGTALLRLRAFFPSPDLVDFSAFYASAAALRQGLSPYRLSADWLAALQTKMLIPGHPPAIYNPPLWPWLLQPLANLRYPSAAWVWLLCNLSLVLCVALIIYNHSTVAQHHTQPGATFLDRINMPISTFSPIAVIFVLFVVICTFGPVFLDLSIGQTSVLLLTMCSIIGMQMRADESWGTSLILGLSIGLSTIAKLYPAAWLVALALMRRWKQLAVSVVFTTAALGAGFLLLPDSSRVYWQRYLPQRLSSATDQVSMDDQSLVAWLDRISRPHTYSVPGLETGERNQIVWEPGWTLDKRWVQIGGYVLCAVSGILVIKTLTCSDWTLGEGGFYLWVLYILVVFPHMERYNHTLLLPAMFWLWQRGQHKLVAIVYLLAGLSRLNHLWIALLPAPWGPLASGFGLFAVLFSIWGMLVELKHHREIVGR